MKGVITNHRIRDSSSFFSEKSLQTGVSNPDRSPSFRSSPSGPFQAGAFAIHQIKLELYLLVVRQGLQDLTPTLAVPLPSPVLKPSSILGTPASLLADFTEDLPGRLRAL